MDVDAFLKELRGDSGYQGQIAHVRTLPRREARCADPSVIPSGISDLLGDLAVENLYCHQADAIDRSLNGEDVLVATGTASGKTLCYSLPLLQTLREDPEATALLLFPTKALTQDQSRAFGGLQEATGLNGRLSGVYDGDTSPATRRKLRDHGSVIFSNPDMVHASIMPHHVRWARFLERLRYLVLDEVHVYSGMFGSNVALMLRRFRRLCDHYGSRPQMVACSATIANPGPLADQLTEREFHLIDEDGSPRGPKTFVMWNPPKVRGGQWRSRRSANVEAHELMARLIERHVPTITFSKAKMTSEMIHRYVCERLEKVSPGLAARVTPYRAGYLAESRREIEARLFSGELLGVSTTSALELGIDVGSLEACILVGYPGKLASFYQQAGRAGRKDAGSVVLLVGLDTTVNQYVMSHPEYLFDRAIEEAVIDPGNPFVATGHVRCAAQEMPLLESEVPTFGPHTGTVLNVLEENLKLKRISDRWYHASSELPQHEVSLRGYADVSVVIQDVETNEVIGQVNQFDAEPILHPEAIYMHMGDTYRVLSLDLEQNVATVKKEAVDYYTQPLGGTDIHHIDNRLREKPFGTGKAFWGEVTAYFRNGGYEKIHFYSLDAISQHDVDLPTMTLETMAFWIEPPEALMTRVRDNGLDPYSGLRAVGYGTRMILPLFMTCDTLDFSHTVGSANSPWHTTFVYERCPHGLGFTEKAYEHLGEILPKVYENVKTCPCTDGCPCCVGKPLRQYATWNVERGEASVPSKQAAMMILEGLLGDGDGLDHPDVRSTTESIGSSELRLAQALKRRLERMREPQVFHPIKPEPEIETAYPDSEERGALGVPDTERRSERKRSLDRDLHKRIDRRMKGKATPEDQVRVPGKSDSGADDGASEERPRRPTESGEKPQSASMGSIASKARKLRKKEKNQDAGENEHV